MPDLYLQQISIGHLSQLIPGLVVTLYLASRRNKTTLDWILVGVFSALLVYIAVGLVAFSFYAPWAVGVNMLQWGALGLAVVGLIQFAYHFAGAGRSREAGVALIITGAAALAMLGYTAWGFFFAPASTTFAYLEITLLLVVGFLWAIVVLLRGSARLTRAAPGAPTGVVWALLRPQGRQASALRSFALAVLLLFLLGVWRALADLRIISLQLFLYVFNLGTLTFIFVFVLVYLNSARQATSFLAKLVGISLASVLITIGIVAFVTVPSHEAAYQRERLLEARLVQELLRADVADWSQLNLTYLVSAPAAGGSPSLPTTHFAREASFDPALLAAEDRWLSTQTPPRVPPDHVLNQRYLGDALQDYFSYGFVEGPTRYEVGFSYRQYRQFIHEHCVVLAYLMLGSSLVILLGFPLFYQASLVRPLYRLLGGVERVNAGDLSVEVPILFEDEIGFLSRSFNRMVGSVRAADQLKDEFLANTSHELRTPLNGMIGIADSLLDGVAGPLTAEQQQNLAMVVASGRRLAMLVNDILDFSSLRHQQLELQLKPLDLRVVAEVVLTLSRPLVGRRELELVNRVSPDLPPVQADENRLQQILHNLIGNAIKFTAQGRVEIDACVEGPMLAITVADSGIGIVPEQQARIFEAFQQADGSTVRRFGGTGLGLAITRQLVELHGGSIGVDSAPDQGARFTFTLPLAVVPAAQDVAPTEAAGRPPLSLAGAEVAVGLAAPEQTRPPGSYTILIVDDDHVNRQVLVNYLSLHGYGSSAAASGAEALEALEGGLRPDLVLLDVMMPHLSGYEVCRILRRSFSAAALPVVLLTAKNQVADLVAGFEVGANDYLTKPVSKAELLARLKTHLGLSKVNLAYSRFVPWEFLSALGKESILDMRLGDHIQLQATLLFSDIRAYTTMSERISSSENLAFLNNYFGRVSPIVLDNRGVIDQYQGDGMKAIFLHDPADAINTAIEMRVILQLYNQDRAGRGLPPVETGIGVHTGPSALGIMGVEPRMQSGVIGDTVNAASRLEGLTKLYGAPIIVTRQVLDMSQGARSYSTRTLGSVRVKGKDEVLSIVEVVDGEAPEQRRLKEQTLGAFHEGLERYREGSFMLAQRCFERVLQANPVDKAAQRYLARSSAWAGRELPSGWLGVEDIEEK